MFGNDTNGELDRNNQPIKPKKSTSDLFGNTSVIAPLPSGLMTTQDFQDDKDVSQERFQFGVGQNQEAIRSGYQSGWQQTRNALAQGIGEATLGTLEGISYLTDVKQMADILQGSEKEYTNWFADLMKEGKEAVNEAAPIYRSEAAQTGFAPTDGSWWADNFKNVASTLSLMVPAMGVTKGLSMLGKAAGASKIINSTKGIRVAKDMTSAVVSRYMENTMEASETFNTAYQGLIEQGYSDEQARNKAGDAASKAWNANWVNLASDFMQYATISKGINISNAASKEFRKTLKDRATDFASNMVQEGIEEGTQFVISKEAERTALEEGTTFFGIDKLGSRLSDYVSDPEFKASVLLGAVGGGVFSAVGNVHDKVVNSKIDRQKDAALAKQYALDNDDITTAHKVDGSLLLSQAMEYAQAGKLNDLKEHYKQFADTSDADLKAANMSDEEIAAKRAADERIAEDINFFEEEFTRIYDNPNDSEIIKRTKLNAFYQKKVLKRAQDAITKELTDIKKSFSDQGADPLHIELKEQEATKAYYEQGKKDYNSFFKDKKGHKSVVDSIDANIAKAAERIEAIKSSLEKQGKSKETPINSKDGKFNSNIKGAVENDIEQNMYDAQLKDVSTKEGAEAVEKETKERLKKQAVNSITDNTDISEMNAALANPEYGSEVKAKLKKLADKADKESSNPVGNPDAYLARYQSNALLARELALFKGRGVNTEGINNAEEFVDRYNKNAKFKEAVDSYFNDKLNASFTGSNAPDVSEEKNAASNDIVDGNIAREVSEKKANPTMVQSNPYIMYNYKDGVMEFKQTSDKSIMNKDISEFSHNDREGGLFILYDADGQPIKSEQNTIEDINTGEVIELVSEETFRLLDDPNTDLIGKPIIFTIYPNSTFGPKRLGSDTYSVYVNVDFNGKLRRIGTLRENNNDASKDSTSLRNLRETIHAEYKASGVREGVFTSSVSNVIVENRTSGHFDIAPTEQAPHTVLADGEPLFLGVIDLDANGEVLIHRNGGEINFNIDPTDLNFKSNSKLADYKGAVVMFVKAPNGKYTVSKLKTLPLSAFPDELLSVKSTLEKFNEDVQKLTNAEEIANLTEEIEKKLSKSIYLRFKYEGGKYYKIIEDKQEGKQLGVSEPFTYEEFVESLESKVMNVELKKLNIGDYNQKLSEKGWITTNLPVGNHSLASMVKMGIPEVIKVKQPTVAEKTTVETKEIPTRRKRPKRRSNLPRIDEDTDRKREKDNSPFKLWDRKTEEAWFKEYYPNVPLTVLDDLKSLGVKGGADLWGLFRNAAIYIDTNAQTGTLYHEAFHAVFNTLMTPDERTALLKLANKETKGAINKEEDLADRFMVYKETQGVADQGFSAKILDFFKRLYNLIQIAAERVGLKNAPSLDSYFYRIDKGLYNKFKAPTFTKNVSRFRVNTSDSVSYLNPREEDHAKKLVNGMIITDILPEYREELNITDKNDQETIQAIIKEGKRTGNLDYSIAGIYTRVYDVLYDELEDRVEKAAKEGTDGRIIKELDALLKSLGEPTKKDLMLEMTPFMSKTLFRLRDHGIKVSAVNNTAKKVTNQVEDSLEMDYNEQEDALEGWQLKTQFISPAEKFSQRVKALFAKVPTRDGQFGGFRVFENTSTVRNTLFRELVGSSSEEDMMNRLRDMVVKFPHYETILKEFEADARIPNEFWINVAQRTQVDFIQLQTTRGGLSSVFTSNRVDMWKDIISSWQNELYTSNSYKNTTGEISISNLDKASEKLETIYKEYGSLAPAIKNSKAVEPKELDYIHRILNHIHIPITLEQLDSIFNTEGGVKQMMEFIGRADKAGLRYVVNTLAKGKDPYLGDLSNKKALRMMSELIVSHSPQLSQPSFRNGEKKTVNSMLQSRFISRFMNLIKHPTNKTNVFKKYDSDPFYGGSPFLEDMKNDGILNQKTNFAVFDSINQEGKKNALTYSSMSPQQLESTKINLWFNRHPDGKSTEYGYYFFPVLADSTNAALMHHKKFSDEEVLKRIVKSAKQERNSIKWINTQIEPVQEAFDKWLSDYLNNDIAVDDKAPIPKELSKIPYQLLINGRQYNSFTFLNDSTKDLTDDEVFASEVEKGVNKIVEEEIKKLYDENVIVKDEKTKKISDNSNIIDVRFFNKFDANIQNYMYNNMYMNFQLLTTFAGNLAYYKGKGDVNMEDVYKRIKQIYSPSEVIGVNPANSFGDFRVRDEYKVGYVLDPADRAQIISEHMDNIDKLFEGDSNKSTRKAYSNLNNTDAATWIDIFRLREIYVGTSNWTDQHQKVYDTVMQDKVVPANAAIIMNPLKPFQFNHTSILQENGQESLISPYQHKNAEFLLLPQMAKGNPKIQMMMEKMGYSFKADGSWTFDTNKRVLDSIMFGTAVKVGQYDTVNKIEDLSHDNVHTFKNSDYGIQMATPEHHLNAEILIGGQIRKLITEGLDMNADYVLNGKTVKGSDIFKMYQDVIHANLLDSYEELQKMWTDENGKLDNTKFVERLVEQAEEDEKAVVQEALTWLDDSKTETVLPLWHPTIADMVEKMFNSFYKNNITKQNINGAALYNASSYGFENENSEGLRKPQIKFNADRSIKHFEVIMPLTSKRIIDKYVDNNGMIDPKKLEKIDPKLLEGIFYRIPTEGKYSMFHIKVIGYVPTGMIIMPDEVTTIAGLDFDIDKLYGMLYNVEEATGELMPDEYAKWQEYDSTPQINKKTGKTFIKNQIPNYDPERGRRDYAKLNDLEWDEEANSFRKTSEIKAVVSGMETKESRDNLMIDLMYSILSNKNTTIQQLSPGNFDTLKGGKDAVLALQGNSSKNDLNPLRPSTLREVFERNMTGLQLIGIFANHNANHALMVHGDFYFRKSININGQKLSSLSNTEINGFNISKRVAEFLAAAVDNAKEPLASFLNITTITADVIASMVRVGIDIDTAIAFSSNPILRKFTKYEQQLGDKDAAISKLISELTKEMTNQKIIGEYNTFREKGTSNSLTLKKSIVDGKTRYTGSLADSIKTEGKKLSELSKEELFVQREVLDLFEKTLEKAETLSKTMGAMRYDSLSNAAGPTIAHTDKKNRLVKTAQDTDGKHIVGFNNFINSGKMPYVNDFHKLGIKPVRQKFYDLTGSPYAKEQGFFKEVIDMFDSYSKEGLSPEEINELYRMTMTIFATDFPTYTHKEMKRVMDTLPKRVQEYNKNNPNGAFELFMKNFTFVPVEYKDGKVVGDIKIPSLRFNRLGLDEVHQQDVRDQWKEMLYSSDPIEVGIAKDLDKYAFFSTGFTFGHLAFKDLTPVRYMSELKENDVYFTDHLEQNFKAESLNEEQKFAIVTQIVRNKYRSMYSIPMVDPDTDPNYELTGTKGNKQLSLERIEQVVTSDKTPIPFIKVPIRTEVNGKTETETVLMELLDGESDILLYGELQPLGVHNKTIEMSLPHAIKGIPLESFYNDLIKRNKIDNVKNVTLNYKGNIITGNTQHKKIISDDDISNFKTYLSKSDGVKPKKFFTPNSTFTEFYNNQTGRREGAPQNSTWVLQENGNYSLLDMVSGELYIENVNLETGKQAVNTINLNEAFNNSFGVPTTQPKKVEPISNSGLPIREALKLNGFTAKDWNSWTNEQRKKFKECN